MTNEEFILQHIGEDTRHLALKKKPEGIDLAWCLQQIEGYQLAKKKLPGWVKSNNKDNGGPTSSKNTGELLWFPPRLSMEQCSSELTAQYKRSVLECCLQEMGMKAEECSFTDLTGGFGIDFSYMAQGFKHATYVERLPHLCDIAHHNFPLLGLSHAHIVNGDAASVIGNSDSSDSSKSMVYREVYFLDPARRDDVGRKVFALEDCTPNLVELQDALLSHADLVMVKLSPMLDITLALRSLKCVSEVHVVSVQGECKEVLLVMKANGDLQFPSDSPGGEHSTTGEEQSIVYHCVNLGTDDDALICNEEERRMPPTLCSPSGESERGFELEGCFLFEPNASILKAGVQDVLCRRYGMQKLHPISNLYVMPARTANAENPENQQSLHLSCFPARSFIIEDVGDFSKAGIKRVLGDLKQANLTIRNFPGTVADLRKRFKLKEGGNVYIFVTTLADGSHAILQCKKA